MNVGAAVVITILLVVAAGGVAWLVYRHGWAGAVAWLRGCPTRTWQSVSTAAARTLSAYQAISDGSGGGGGGGGSGARKRAMTHANIDQLRWVRFTEPGHRFSFLYPATWVLARSDNPAASIIVQVTCDNREESYKRFSVAWDDVSWSPTTADSFARSVVDQLPSMVPGSELVSHGWYEPHRRGDGAYHIVYRVADALEPTQSPLQLLNVIVVSAHGGRRRAYTITFGVDADAYHDVARLAKHMVASFTIDGLVLDAPGCGGGGGTGLPVAAGAGGALGATPSAGGGTVASGGRHVNIWERATVGDDRKGVGGGGPTNTGAVLDAAAMPASTLARGEAPLPGETPANPASVAWQASAITAAGMTYSHPATWLCSGLGHDESQGFAPVAVHSVRRWCISYTCDRREHAYKHMSVVCVDITPLLDVVTTRLAKAPGALEGVDVGTLLLIYLTYRYRCEVAEQQALASGTVYVPPPLGVGEEPLTAWVEIFTQCWPPPCRLATPLSLANASRDALAPIPSAITEARAMSTSRLLKVAGWLRSGGIGAASGHPVPESASSRASSPRHHSSTHSSWSLDADNAVAEGWLIDTTAAVLVGVHDAMVVTGGATRAMPGRTTTPQRRVFGHVVTVATASDIWPAYEGFARRVFQGLHASGSSGSVTSPRPPGGV